MRRTLSNLLASKERVLGTWTQIANGDVIDMLGVAGFDFTIIDCEHGAFGIETAETLIRACEAANVIPCVRVPRGDVVSVYKALDAGARAVFAPSVESADEVSELISYTRFAPEGKRGACPIVRGAEHSAMDWKSFVNAQNDCGLIAMIETEKGVANCDDILRAKHLKAVLIGPFDLSVSMGCAGDHRHADVQRAIRSVIDSAKRANLPVIMPVFSPLLDETHAQIAEWEALGVTHFAIGADKIIIANALRQYVAAARRRHDS
jgi:4-hydroxy-2-oxoheptanedioate aldolase